MRHYMINTFSLLWATLLLALPLYCVAIKWLALHRVQPPWTNSGDCPRSREERRVFGLITYQERVCVRVPELIPYIISASLMTVELCQTAFADRRWNCSSILSAPDLSAELKSGTKEQAFVYALSSAAVTHQIAKACSSGQLANCPCGIGDTVTTNAIDPTAKNLLQHNLTELSYKWKGCSDNVVQGRRISREWSDSKWRPNLEEAINEIATRNNWNIVNTEAIGEGSDDYIEDDHMRKSLKLKRHSPGSKRNGQKARMNEFNNEIGRQVVEQSLYKKCKCHGVSSSCDVKTCWHTLPRLEHIVTILKKKYDNARPMIGLQPGASLKRWKGKGPDSDDEIQSLVKVEMGYKLL